MDMKDVVLGSRYLDNNFLKYIETVDNLDKYELIFDDNAGKYWRTSVLNRYSNKDGDFIDPSGGPFMQIGYFEIGGRKLIAIDTSTDKIYMYFETHKQRVSKTGKRKKTTEN